MKKITMAYTQLFYEYFDGMQIRVSSICAIKTEKLSPIAYKIYK